MEKASIVQRLSGNNDAGMEKAAKKSLIRRSCLRLTPQFGTRLHEEKKCPLLNLISQVRLTALKMYQIKDLLQFNHYSI